jgi:rhomboid protease GluP
LSQPDQHNQDDDLQQLLRRIDEESGQHQAREPAPAQGEAQPIPKPSYQLRLPLGTPRAIWVILAINIAVFVIPALLDLIGVRIAGLRPSEYILDLGAKDNASIKLGGQYYRFLTSMFLHAGLLHIGFNAYALYAIGPETERLYRTPRFLALYFIAGFGGALASYMFTPNPGVGASGAIFGLIGGLAAFYYVSRQLLGDIARRQIGNLITIIMINLFIGFSTPLIDNSAHIGGLIIGALVGWLLAPRFEVDQRFYPPVVERRSLPLAWGWALGVLALLIALALLINPPIR